MGKFNKLEILWQINRNENKFSGNKFENWTQIGHEQLDDAGLLSLLRFTVFPSHQRKKISYGKNGLSWIMIDVNSRL